MLGAVSHERFYHWPHWLLAGTSLSCVLSPKTQVCLRLHSGFLHWFERKQFNFKKTFSTSWWKNLEKLGTWLPSTGCKLPNVLTLHGYPNGHSLECCNDCLTRLEIEHLWTHTAVSDFNSFFFSLQSWVILKQEVFMMFMDRRYWIQAGR